jgi:hypothetical protein
VVFSLMVASVAFLPVPKADILFVAALWLYSAICTLVYPMGNHQAHTGPMTLRPVGQAPLRMLTDLHQFTSLTVGLLFPLALIAISRSLRIKFATDDLREAVASQVFLQLAQYMTDGMGQWPVCLAPPVWLSVCQFATLWRLHSNVDWCLKAGAATLLPSHVNRYGLAALKWVAVKRPVRAWMAAMTKLAGVACLATSVFEAAVVSPLVECAAFAVKHCDSPPLAPVWEKTHGAHHGHGGMVAAIEKEE